MHRGGSLKSGCVRMVMVRGWARLHWPSPMPKSPLLQSLRANLRLRHFSPRTEEAYTRWTRRYARFHRLRHPRELGESDVPAFLTHLAQERMLAPSTLAALLFLCKELLRQPLSGLGGDSAGTGARATPRCPDARRSAAWS